MSIRTFLRASLYGAATAGLAGLAAYVGARASAHATASSLAELVLAVNDLTKHVQKTDYWTIYSHVQQDLIGSEDHQGR